MGVNLEKFLKLAYPSIASELLEAAASEIVGPTGDELRSLRIKLENSEEEVDLLRQDVSRLNNELLRHKDGIANATKAGLDVLGERARQRRMEGYDDEHDDGHDDFSLTAAAVSFALDARLRANTGEGYDRTPPGEWPWMASDWKPKEIRRSLEVAAALLIAEIERLDRLS